MSSEKEKFQKKFGQHLRKFREERDFSIRDIELKDGIDRSNLSRIESGKMTLTVYTLNKILKIMGATESEFYSDFDPNEEL